MDLEEDMHDAYDEDYLDDDDDYGFVDSGADDLDDPDFSTCHPQLNYTILSEEDIHQCQEEALTSISTVLSISRVNAGMLLRHFKWYCLKYPLTILLLFWLLSLVSAA